MAFPITTSFPSYPYQPQGLNQGQIFYEAAKSFNIEALHSISNSHEFTQIPIHYINEALPYLVSDSSLDILKKIFQSSHLEDISVKALNQAFQNAIDGKSICAMSQFLYSERAVALFLENIYNSLNIIVENCESELIIQILSLPQIQLLAQSQLEDMISYLIIRNDKRCLEAVLKSPFAQSLSPKILFKGYYLAIIESKEKSAAALGHHISNHKLKYEAEDLEFYKLNSLQFAAGRNDIISLQLLTTFSYFSNKDLISGLKKSVLNNLYHATEFFLKKLDALSLMPIDRNEIYSIFWIYFKSQQTDLLRLLLNFKH
jgi:hypothetical protein